MNNKNRPFYGDQIKQLKSQLKTPAVNVVAGSFGVGKSTFIKNATSDKKIRYVDGRNIDKGSVEFAFSHFGSFPNIKIKESDGISGNKKQVLKQSFYSIYSNFSKVIMSWQYFSLMISTIVAALVPLASGWNPLLFLSFLSLFPLLLLFVLYIIVNARGLLVKDEILIIDNLDRIDYLTFKEVIKKSSTVSTERKIILVFDLDNIGQRYHEEYGFGIDNPIYLLEKYFDNIINLELYTHLEVKNLAFKKDDPSLNEYIQKINRIGFTNLRIIKEVIKIYEDEEQEMVKTLGTDPYMSLILKSIKLLNPKLYVLLWKDDYFTHNIREDHDANHDANHRIEAEEFRKRYSNFKEFKFIETLINRKTDVQNPLIWSTRDIYFNFETAKIYERSVLAINASKSEEELDAMMKKYSKNNFLLEFIKSKYKSHLTFSFFKILIENNQRGLKDFIDLFEDIDDIFEGFKIVDIVKDFEAVNRISHLTTQIRIQGTHTDDMSKSFMMSILNSEHNGPNIKRVVKLFKRYFETHPEEIRGILTKPRNNDYSFDILSFATEVNPEVVRGLLHNYLLDMDYLHATYRGEVGIYANAFISIVDALKLNRKHMIKWPKAKFIGAGVIYTPEQLMKLLGVK